MEDNLMNLMVNKMSDKQAKIIDQVASRVFWAPSFIGKWPWAYGIWAKIKKYEIKKYGQGNDTVIEFWVGGKKVEELKVIGENWYE
jgi:hypothetical protein